MLRFRVSLLHSAFPPLPLVCAMTTANPSSGEIAIQLRTRILMFAALMLAMLSTVAFATVASGADQFALVIGNSDYGKTPLRNPDNDADLMSAALRDVGFDVMTYKNVDIDEFDGAIRSFLKKLTPGSVAFFYFAGHGLQVDGVNYLVPVGHGIKEKYEVERKCVKLDSLVSTLKESASNMNVLVLDACRDNPFDRSWSRALDSKGLAGIEAPEGTVIAYSTDKGRVALDGDGQNSPYTASLVGVLNSLPDEGLEIVDVFRQASRNVYQMTRQRPFLDFSAYSERFYLLPAGASPRIEDSREMATRADAEETAEVALDSPPQDDPAGSRTAKPSVQDPRLKQARIFANEREFELAIEAFSSVIENKELSLNLRNQARRGRGGAYLSRLEGDDIKRAIVDYQAAGEQGIRLSVRAEEAVLKTQSEIRGKVLRGQVVYVTEAHGNWLWVASVQDDPNRSGWIDRSALLRSQAAKVDSPATETTNSPSITPADGGIGETVMIDPSGRPIKQSRTDSGQIITYDQYGRQIIGPSSSNQYAWPNDQSGSSRLQTQSGTRSFQPSNSANRRKLLTRPPVLIQPPTSPLQQLRRYRTRIGR